MLKGVIFTGIFLSQVPSVLRMLDTGFIGMPDVFPLGMLLLIPSAYLVQILI